ncbi:MAG: phosphoribosylaminoimidazole carboxylase catalytic subunit PurE [Ilumatobacteraceae bacterium]|nr:phosphoribosylaminoimidazole carboxylase catalytic subunit PurE [Ilumatobacteraceae bacterium]
MSATSDTSNATSPLVVILMGSAADKEHCAKIAGILAKLGVDHVQRVGSAHKTPEHVLEIVAHYEGLDRPVVWVTVAGRSNALSAFVDAKVVSPVVSCPPLSMPEDVWSSLRMPSDVAPLVVLDPGNAGLAAAKIAGLYDPELRRRIADHKAGEAAKVTSADAEIQT